MTNTLYNTYYRQEDLKTWKPIPNLHLTPEETQYYDYKMKEDDVNIRYPQDVLNEAEFQPLIDDKYLKQIVLIYMTNLIKYIESKGVVLEDIEWNIKLILNEIITNQVTEDYYLNTIDIYESLLPNFIETDIYYLIDQAIRLDNKRMLYYLIFMEDENMKIRLEDAISK